MATSIKILFTLILLTNSVYAAPWDLFGSWPTPGINPRGYSGGGGEFIVQDGPEPYIYRIWLTSYGETSIISSFPAPGGPAAWGLVYDPMGGDYFRVSNNLTSWIYKITMDGSVVSSFFCPLPGPAGMDITYDYSPSGGYLFVAIPAQNLIAEINQNTGSLMRTFAAPGVHPTAYGAVAYSHGYPYYVTDDYTHKVYKNATPVITLQNPVGFSYWSNTNGQITLIFVVDDTTDYIYVYETDETYSSAAPASLGRIKALFK